MLIDEHDTDIIITCNNNDHDVLFGAYSNSISNYFLKIIIT